MTDDLSTLLHDAVSDVEPDDRLDEIRARTASPARSAARPWFYAAGATVLATAATVAAFAVLGDGDDNESGPAHDMHSQLVAAYFVGDSPQGPRLYREFDQVPAGDPLQAALDRIEQPAQDPDYRTSWTPDSFGDVSVDEQGIHVELLVDDLSDELAVQQVVYTLQAAAGERLPVWIALEGQRGNMPYNAEPENDVLNLVSISDPAEGVSYSGSFTARGRANSFEATVGWKILDGDDVVLENSTTASSGDGLRLYPWETTIDISSLEPGTYTFVASTDDAAVEPPGPSTDTRTITVR